MTYDSAAWGALAFALSVLLGVVTFFRWRARGLAAGLRGSAWTILPVAAWLTGVLELAFDIGDSVGRWALHLVFSPVVWLGIVLVGVSVVLFGASAVLGGRGGREVDAKGTPAVVDRRRSGPPAIDEDLGDIEAILRKHGIS
ncbi:cellulose synthase [Nocardioides pocheonensis]|uniref:Cellulose synthase n=1 Tax=Nocardioides pocheonensis TaxID=661485 RepID=A0A3N0GF17_9ACTN|nr:cellulose synthase [Nocardioides pocheonensis]RNM11055.1 cellulose synthase [Nocardioides pocheonensis]